MGSGPGRPDTPSSVPESPGRGVKRNMKAQGGPPNPRRKKQQQQQPPPMSPMTTNTQMGPGPQMHPQMQVATKLIFNNYAHFYISYNTTQCRVTTFLFSLAQ